MMIEIIPAILPKSFDDLKASLDRISYHVSEEEDDVNYRFVQIDVVDGAFAPNKTWPFADGASFEAIVAGEEGLPFWQEFDFEFDCMIKNPLEHIERFIQAGAMRIVTHSRGEELKKVLELLAPYRRGELPLEVGVALVSADLASSLEQFEGMYDYAQVMGIEKVGFQGSAFDERALGLITSLRAAYPQLTIQIDGGVKVSNARAIAQAGCDRLIAGSAVFGSDDPLGAIEALERAART